MRPVTKALVVAFLAMTALLIFALLRPAEVRRALGLEVGPINQSSVDTRRSEPATAPSSLRPPPPSPAPREAEKVTKVEQPLTDETKAKRALVRFRAFADIRRILDDHSLSLSWATEADVPALSALIEKWKPEIRVARTAVDDAARPLHMERIEKRQAQEVLVEKEGEKSPLSDLQQPQHAGQVVMVGRYTDAITGIATYRVSRFEPGEDAAIDAAMARLTALRRDIRTELDIIRAGR